MAKKYKTKSGYEGLLIVIEGTDGSGKSTQLELLKRSIQDKSYGVMVSEWKTSRLIAKVIDDAKERNLLNATTYSLLYAADFADRLENQIIPALKSGFIVLLDRYYYTALARDVVRGQDINWVKNLYDYSVFKEGLLFKREFSLDSFTKAFQLEDLKEDYNYEEYWTFVNSLLIVYGFHYDVPDTMPPSIFVSGQRTSGSFPYQQHYRFSSLGGEYPHAYRISHKTDV